MSEHTATIRWANPAATMDYDQFSRDHTWELKEGRQRLAASAAPAYKGNPASVDPEDALVAALSGCHMLTFLAIAAKKRLVVKSYVDHAVGHLEAGADGRIAMTRAELRPAVVFAPGTVITPADYAKLHEKAHANCFIANSVKTAVACTPRPLP